MKVGLDRHSHKSQNQKAEDTWIMDLDELVGASVGNVVDVENVAEGKDLDDRDLVVVEQAEREDQELEFLPKDQIPLQAGKAAVEEKEVVDTAVGHKVVV